MKKPQNQNQKKRSKSKMVPQEDYPGKFFFLLILSHKQDIKQLKSDLENRSLEFIFPRLPLRASVDANLCTTFQIHQRPHLPPWLRESLDVCPLSPSVSAWL